MKPGGRKSVGTELLKKGGPKRRPDEQALERAAVRAADGVLRGDEVGGGRAAIGRGAAAAPPHPLGAGETLPRHLRSHIGTALGADLSALRVHRDTRAAAAARLEGAEAFAAGVHLVFGEGAYQPASREGLRLIVHETVHALQQAGRADGRGGLRLVPTAGSARVGVLRKGEHEDDQEEPASLLELEGGKDVWPTLKHIYARATGFTEEFERGAKYDALVAKLEKGPLAGGLPHLETSPQGQALAAWVRGGGLKGSTRFLFNCLVFDALKAAHEYDAAQEMIEADARLETSFNLTLFNERFFDGGLVDPEAWAVRVLDQGRSKFLISLWEEMKARILALALTPGGVIPKRSPLRDVIARSEGLTPGGQTLRPNVAQLGTVWEFETAEVLLYKHLQSVLDSDPFREAVQHGLPTSSPTMRLLRRSRALDDALNGETDVPPPPFVLRLREQLGPRAAEARLTAERALGLFGRLDETAASGGSFDFLFDRASGESVEFALGEGAIAYLDGLATLVADVSANGVFGLRPEEKAKEAGGTGDPTVDAIAHAQAIRERMLEAAEYNRRLSAFGAGVKTLKGALHTELANAALQAEPAFVADGLTERGSLTFLGFWTDWLPRWIAAHQAEGGPDEVGFARFELARVIDNLGGATGHTGLRAEARSVIHAGDIGESYGIIPGEGFKEDTSVDISELAYEGEAKLLGNVFLPGGGRTVLRSALPLSASMLVEFYELTFLRAVLPQLTGEIEKQRLIARANKALPPEAEFPAPPPDTVRSLVERVREQTPHPRFWKAEDGRFVRNPTDTRNANETLGAHPRLQALFNLGPLASERSDHPWEGRQAVRNADDWSEMYTWSLPPFDPVVEYLKQIPTVQTIRETWQREGLNEPTAAVDWLIQLYAWSEEHAESAALRQDIGSRLDEELNTKRDAYIVQMRALSTVNRHITVDFVKDLLGRLTSGQLRYNNLMIVDVIDDQIHDYVRGVVPKEDRKTQMAILMIELAPSILKVVNERTGYAHVHAFFNPVALALSAATGGVVFGTTAEGELPEQSTAVAGAGAALARAGASGRFKTKAKPFDTSGEELDEGVKTLRTILTTLDASRREGQANFALFGEKGGGLHSELARTDIVPGTDNAVFVLALPYPKDVHAGGASRAKSDWHPAQERVSPAQQAEARTADVDGPAAEARPARPEPWRRDEIVNTHYPILYRIDEIHRSFEFTAPSRAAGGASDLPGKTTSGTKSQRELPDDAELLTFTFSHIVEVDGETRFTPERTVTVHAGDHALLELLTFVIDHQSRLVQLQNLADTIEMGAELMLDVLEFIPGIGQAIMIARLGANVAEVIAGTDWDDVRRQISEDPLGQIELIADKFIPDLDAVTFWRILMSSVMSPGNAQAVFDRLNTYAEDSKTKSKQAQTDPKLGKSHQAKFRKFVVATKLIALRFLDAFLNVQRRLATGFAGVQGDVQANPTLRMHLAHLEDYFTWGEALADVVQTVTEFGLPEGLSDADAELFGSIARGEFGGVAAMLGESLKGALDPVAEFELPGEVFPVDLMTEIVLEFTLGKVRNKKFRAVYEALRITGGLDMIADLIASELLVGTRADPNVHWKTYVYPHIAGPFEEGRDALVGAIFEAINAAVPGTQAPPPALRATSVKDEPFEFDEAEAFVREGDALSPQRPVVPPSGGGEPLPRHIRTRLQGEFGHDFGHVRMHRDRAADHFAESHGAEGLTSGSHVYIRDGLDLGSDLGDHVLRHELAHVLQQTGPRPVGEAHDRSPQRGRPGRGLRVDATREHAAERMANQSTEARFGNDDPARVEGVGEVALAPFSRVDVVGMLVGLTRKEDNTKALSINLAGGNKARAKALKDRATALFDDLVERLKHDKVPGTKLGWAPAVLKEINSYVHDQIKGDEGIMFRIAERAKVEIPETRRKGKQKWELAPQPFLNLVEGYVFSKTGVRLTLESDKTHPDKIESAVLRFVHLGGVRANSKPYIRAREQYEKHDKLTDVEFAQVRSYLRGRFPLPHRWNGSSDQPRLHENTLGEIKAATATPTGVKAEDLPPWNEYKRTDNRSERHSLTVATHGELGGLGPWGRESHHLPQFLLGEFYSGLITQEGPVSPFGFGSDRPFWTPGFKAGGTKITRKNAKAKAPYTKHTSDLAGTLKLDALGLKSNRGAGMPAVSLAARTHKKGGLHLHRERAWSDEKETHSGTAQGFTIMQRHREYLTGAVEADSRLRTGADAASTIKSPEGFAAMVDAAMSERDQEKALEDATAKAMRRSYKMFVEKMVGSLRTALVEHEKPYYTGLAADHPKFADNPANPWYGPSGDTGWVESVMDAIQAKNKTVYDNSAQAGKWGFSSVDWSKTS